MKAYLPILTLALAASFPLQSKAADCLSSVDDNEQSTTNTIKPIDRFGVTVQTGWGVGSKGYYPVLLTNRYSYEFIPKLKAVLNFDMAYAHHHDDKTYRATSLLGGGLAYRLVGGRINRPTTPIALDLVAYGGHSLGNTNWKQAYGDVGLEAYFRNPRHTVNFTFGLHYRYAKSKTDAPNLHMGYLTFGFVF